MKKPWKVLATAVLSSALLAACSSGGDTEETPVEDDKKVENQEEVKTEKKDETTAVHPDYDKYATEIESLKKSIEKYKDPAKALEDGYVPYTPHIPMMGYHFVNLDVKGFNIEKPSILLYTYVDGEYKLVAGEWASPNKDLELPFEGVDLKIVHKASAHYVDGSELEVATKEEIPEIHPETGSKLKKWHPDLYGLHVYTHVHNPEGPFVDNNPAMAQYSDAPVLPPGYESYFEK